MHEHHEHHHHRHHRHHHHHHRERMEIDRRYPELYHRMLPYIEEAHMTNRDLLSRMDEAQLEQVAWDVMQNSDVLRHIPQGHTEETVKDMAKVMLLTHTGMEPSAEAMSPLLPWVLGLGNPFFYYPYPFFFGPRGHFRHHHRRGFHGRRGRW